MSERKRKLARALQLQLQIKLTGGGGEETPRNLQYAQQAKEGTLQPSQGALNRAQSADQIAEDQMTIAAHGGVGGGSAMKAVQGIPFVGEWVDEGLDKINPGQGERVRAVQDAMDRQYPKTALASEIGGGVAGTALAATALRGLGPGGLATAPLRFIGNAASGVGRVGRAATVAGVAGGVEGVVSGAGRDEENRGRGAATGGAIGGTLGGVLGGLAPLVGESVTALTRRFKKLDVETIADELGVSAEAARTVKAAIMNDDLDAAGKRLAQLGDDAMLADSGPATSQLLNASASTGGQALTTARNAVEARSQRVGQRLRGTLDSILGQPVGVKSAARNIAEKTAPARKAAYDRAYATPIDYAGNGRTIESVLERVPPNTLQRAIGEANEAMQEAGERNLQIMAQIGDDGAVVFREMPNVRQLDEIKRALDNIGRESVDQFGRPTAQGARAKRLARSLRDAVSEAVPDYGRALKIGGDKLQQDEALDLGRNLLFKRTTVEDVREFMAGGVSQEARQAARQGIRDSIEQTMGDVRRTITDPNTDAREAMQLLKEMSSRANMAKLRMVLGPKKARELLDEVDKSASALLLRSTMSRNSDTAIRQSIQGQVRDETTPGLLRRTLGKGGNPFDAAREITEEIAGIDPRSIGDRERRIFGEIAGALTQIKGADAQRALQAIQNAMQGQPIKDAEAKLIGDLVAESGAGFGYQVGSQSLEPQ